MVLGLLLRRRIHRMIQFRDFDFVGFEEADDFLHLR